MTQNRIHKIDYINLILNLNLNLNLNSKLTLDFTTINTNTIGSKFFNVFKFFSIKS